MTRRWLGHARRGAISYPGGHNEGFADTFKQLFSDFYGAIAAGNFADPDRTFPTFDDGHHEILVCEAILKSHRNSNGSKSENNNMMQLGFVSAILPDLSLDEVFETAAQIGYDCVEVMCWPVGKATRRYAGITHIDVADIWMTPHRADPRLVGEVQRRDQWSGLLSQRACRVTPRKRSKRSTHIRAVITAAAKLGRRSR